MTEHGDRHGVLPAPPNGVGADTISRPAGDLFQTLGPKPTLRVESAPKGRFGFL